MVEAYSVLSKEKERQMYDFKTGIKSDPEQFQTSRTGQGGDNKQRQGWRGLDLAPGDEIWREEEMVEGRYPHRW